MHCCECQLFKAQTSMANEYNSSLAIQRTLLPDFGCEMSGRWHKRQWFAYLLGDTERGGDALRGGDLLPLRAGLRDLDADLEADLQLNHASCHTQDALTEIANAQHVRRQRSQGESQQLIKTFSQQMSAAYQQGLCKKIMTGDATQKQHTECEVTTLAIGT